MRVTKEVRTTFGVGRSHYEIYLPAGLRVRRIEGEPGVQQYFLDEFPVNLFPIDSFIRHDAIHYGIRLSESETEEI